MRRFITASAVALVVVLLPLSLTADVLVNVPLQPWGGSGGAGIAANQWMAQAFTISQPYFIEEVGANVGLQPGAMMYLTSALNSSSILYTSGPLGSLSAWSSTNFAVNAVLNPGTYFIVFGYTSYPANGFWGGGNESLLYENGAQRGFTYWAFDTTTGTQQSLDSTWSGGVYYPNAFHVSGHDVPEPGTLLLLGAGSFLIGIWRRRV